jgi:hypothetical protein
VQDYYPPNDNLPTGLFLSAEDVVLEYARPALWYGIPLASGLEIVETLVLGLETNEIVQTIN